MRSYVIYGPDSYQSMRWRNGLGHTLQLMKQNLSESDRFAWRLSIADVTTDGEFSNFSGYDRTLLLLSGAGITLQFAKDRRVDLNERLDRAEFKGDEPTAATLHDGPITDFNVMCARDHCRAAVLTSNTHNAQAIEVHGDVLLLYALGDGLTIRSPSDGDVPLADQHLLLVTKPIDKTLYCEGAAFIAVQITYRA